MDDMDVPIWQEVMPMLAQAIGAVIDKAVLLGTNKPATWPTAIITEAASRSHVVTVPGSSPDYYDLIMGPDGVIAKVEEDGFFVSGHAANISMRAKLRGVRDEVGQPIFMPSMQPGAQYMLDGAPMYFPRNGSLPSEVLDIVGDWSQLVYSVRRDMTWDIFREGVISDPTTKLVVTNLMQQRMTALMVTMRIGFALPNPVNMVQPDGTARYPFAVLAANGASL
jgi:HK97 family phage major capsid protein